MLILAPVSVGDLLDRISILAIKAGKITDPAKQANVMRELAALDGVRGREVASAAELDAFYAELLAINRGLWDIEERLRRHEREGRFDDRFIELARSVYRMNDLRAFTKRRINKLTESEIIEEKSYVADAVCGGAGGGHGGAGGGVG
jgi:Family of unknown function (DUF6165)